MRNGTSTSTRRRVRLSIIALNGADQRACLGLRACYLGAFDGDRLVGVFPMLSSE